MVEVYTNTDTLPVLSGAQCIDSVSSTRKCRQLVFLIFSFKLLPQRVDRPTDPPLEGFNQIQQRCAFMGSMDTHSG